jgi:hypothetical protein
MDLAGISDLKIRVSCNGELVFAIHTLVGSATTIW